MLSGGRSGEEFDGLPVRPSAGQLPEMAIMAAVFCSNVHGPCGALALAAGVRQYSPALKANMVCVLVCPRLRFICEVICHTGSCLGPASRIVNSLTRAHLVVAMGTAALLVSCV